MITIPAMNLIVNMISSFIAGGLFVVCLIVWFANLIKKNGWDK